MGKICIIKASYSEAMDCLEKCLMIKKDLFKYQPRSSELLLVHKLIKGLAKLLEAQIDHTQDK